MNREKYLSQLGVLPALIALSDSVEQKIAGKLQELDKIREINQYKVMVAMQKNALSETHFAGTTGYGYGDAGREKLDKICADVFGCEDALVRHQIVSGTHAISIAILGNLRPGDHVVFATGKPYDTLDEVIGISGNNPQSLRNSGVTYDIVDFTQDGTINFEHINQSVAPNTKMLFIQRSRGYSVRPTLFMHEIDAIVKLAKSKKPDILVMVDNCYGEFVEEEEPTEVGADLVAGSLIKNPGGGIAPCGGYVAGRAELVKKAAERLTSPGIGKKVGATMGFNRLFFQGLFLAPHMVTESLKGSVYATAMMAQCGFNVAPTWNSNRGDIISSIEFGDPKAVILFCQAIQKGSPVDSFVSPEPWDMPGYDAPVIMAAGTFIAGASLELSADAPIRPPYIAYMQGGLVYEHVKLSMMAALSRMLQEGLLHL